MSRLTFQALMLATLILMSATLTAEENSFTFNVEVTVVAPAGDLAEATLSLTADPYWGHGTKTDHEQFVAKYGEPPEVEVTGASVLKDRIYTAELTATVKGDGKFPETRVSPRNMETRPFIYLVIKFSMPGFVSFSRTEQCIKGEDLKTVVALRPGTTLSGRLIDPDGKPLVGQRIQNMWFNERVVHYGRKAVVLGEATTDENGAFVLRDDACGSGYIMLRLVGSDWTWPLNSPWWKGRTFRRHERELGDLKAVKGGCITASARSDTAPRLEYVIRPASDPIYATPLYGDYVRDGRLECGCVPLGEYVVNVSARGHWIASLPVSITKPGQIVDAGEAVVREQIEHKTFVRDSNGELIKQAHAMYEYLGEDVPFEAVHQRKPGGNWTVHPSSFKGEIRAHSLLAGRWRVTAISRQHVSESVEIELPGPDLEIVLGDGGCVRVKVLDPYGGFHWPRRCWAVSTKCPNYEAYTTDTYPEEYSGDFEEIEKGVWTPAQNRPKEEGFSKAVTPLPPGEYAIVAEVQYGGLFRFSETGVKVEHGDVKDVVFKLPQASLRIVVTENGVPVAGHALQVVRGKELFKEVVTDDEGVATIENPPIDNYTIVNEDEMKWVTSRGGLDRIHGKSLPGARVQVRVGEASEVKIELHDPNLTWLTIKVTTGDESVSRYVVIVSENRERVPYYNGYVRVGEADLAGRFPLGKYHVELGMQIGSNVHTHLEKSFELHTPGEQSVEINFDFGRIEGRVKIPEGRDHYEIDVRAYELYPASPRGYRLERQVEVKKDGSYTIDALPYGEYRVVSCCGYEWPDAENILLVSATTFHLESAVHKCDLQYREDVGTILFTLNGTPNIPETLASRHPLNGVVQLKQEGKVVLPPLPEQCVINAWRRKGMKIDAVPAGRYELTALLPGLRPFTREIEVKKGEKLKIEVEAETAASITLELDRTGEIKRSTKITITYKDADGKTIENEAPWLTGWHMLAADRILTLAMLSVPANATKIRIELDDYVPIELEIDADVGAKNELAATAVRAD